MAETEPMLEETGEDMRRGQGEDANEERESRARVVGGVGEETCEMTRRTALPLFVMKRRRML
jgi:hypothetical protein